LDVEEKAKAIHKTKSSENENMVFAIT